MMMKIVCVRDSGIDAFLPPFAVQHTGQAVRSFRDECNKPDTPLSAHPGDYELYLIGEYDDQNGVLLPLLNQKQLLIRGKDCKENGDVSQ